MASDNQDRWTEEVQVTFDSQELAAFFDVFEPLEIGDDGFPRLPTSES